jgi:hypothetical protein
MHTNGVVWAVLAAAAAVAVAVIVRTKWLQSHTLPKCVLLSVVLHAVVAVVCTCLGGLPPASWGQDENGPMTMLVVMAEEPAQDPVSDAAAPSIAAEPSADALDTAVLPSAVGSAAMHESVDPPADHVPLLEVAGVEEVGPDSEPTSELDGAPITVPAAAGEELEQSSVAAAAVSTVSTASPSPAPQMADVDVAPRAVPPMYADRVASRRPAAAAARGGSQETERAVQASLAWLAAAQSSDGRWAAARHGGGVERSVQGHHRHGVGAKSDHGVTGLALLAFLGAGNTHQDGGYSETVARGLRFLIERQRADGSLAGDAEFFAALYCHGMAAIALAECAAMTGDASLRAPLEKAVRYTLSLQSPATGGWRYAAGDKGDTSQLGWQVMLLASARQAGLTGIEPAEARARTFLQSVSSGRAGGLAAYRSGERPSMAMTAEALVCRLFLGMPADHPCAAEAVDLLARTPPVASSPNAYAWYYATLASFQVGGPQWEAWNSRLQAALLPLQRRESSPLDGSWDPDPVWGGHGGRVYATAMAAMTLEVYYRHLPMHGQIPLAAVPGSSPR